MAELGVYFEHPTWFQPLFAALERHGVDWIPIPVEGCVFDPADTALPAPVIFNRLAMSSFLRQDEPAIFYAQALTAHWAHVGARVINGAAALAIDSSKARQLSLLRALGLKTPRTRVVHRRRDIAQAAADLGFPILIKANIGGSGAGMARYDNAGALAAALTEAATPTSLDGVILVQDYVPARDGRVVRCETLDGQFLYAIALDGAVGTFDLCPADVCAADRLAAGALRVTITAFDPPSDIVKAVELIAQASHIDVGGVEYMVDDRDGEPRFYDINALSNFVAEPVGVLGYDPHDRLVDFLKGEIAKAARDAV